MIMKKISNKNFSIYTHHTKKFKTIGAMLVFINNVSLKDLIYATILSSVLTYSNKKYQTNRDLLIACQKLYDLAINNRVIRSDNKLVTVFDFYALNPKYTSKKCFSDSVNLLKECLLEPNVLDNHFDKDTLEVVKKRIKNDIVKGCDYPQEFLNEKLYVSLDNTSLSITLHNSLKYLDEINEYSLYEYYKEFMNNQDISLYLSGDFDDYVVDEFKSLPLVSKKIKLNDNQLLMVNDKKIHYIENNYNQNKISCLLRYSNITKEEYYYTSMMFNAIFGDLQDSILMTNLREKSSLVYYIDSYIRRFDQVMLVNAGFSIENTNKVLKGIKDNLKLIQKGEFSDNLVTKARESLITVLKDNESSQFKLLNYMIGVVNFFNVSNKERIRKYKLIDKDKIVAFAKKIEIAKIYILWEDQDGKEA